MGLLKEFKEFAVKGNMVDMAVGIIIGAAFGKVVSSLVNDLIMPPIGLILGGKDFAKLSLVLKSASEGQEAVILRYGAFIGTLLDFLIISLAIFLMIKGINRLRKADVPPPPSTKDCPKCFSSIPIKAVKCPNCTADIE